MDDEEVTPTCDICGEPEDQEPTNGREYDWNGETGSHQSCERYLIWSKNNVGLDNS